MIGRAAPVVDNAPSASNFKVHTLPLQWGGVTVYLHGVQVAPAVAPSRGGAPATDGVFVFAFCKVRAVRSHACCCLNPRMIWHLLSVEQESCSKPFAMSGMRHMLYQHLGSSPTGGAPAVRRGAFDEHQYSTSRQAMLQSLQLAVDPLASSLNHRQRFALQHSFLLQACIMHPKTLGPHKRMLRNLTTEWYQVCVCVCVIENPASLRVPASETSDFL